MAGEHSLSGNDGTEQFRGVSRIVEHEDYQPLTINNDMCLLTVDRPLTLNAEVVPVSLPSAGQQFTGDALVSGWGTLVSGGFIPDLLHSVTVPLVSDADCADAYGPGSIVPETMLCAGERGKDSCQV